jgi:uncharacterized protein YehS (DUF1456 family)
MTKIIKLIQFQVKMGELSVLHREHDKPLKPHMELLRTILK